MTEENEKKYTPILPFDCSGRDRFSMYDTMPYVCDRDLCRGHIQKTSSNIIKYYLCHISEEKLSIAIS